MIEVYKVYGLELCRILGSSQPYHGRMINLLVLVTSCECLRRRLSPMWKVIGKSNVLKNGRGREKEMDEF